MAHAERDPLATRARLASQSLAPTREIISQIGRDFPDAIAPELNLHIAQTLESLQMFLESLAQKREAASINARFPTQKENETHL